MRILVTGKNGQLGKSIHKIVANDRQIDDFVFVGRKELDLNNEGNITHYFNKKFDIIINCAAYTAVDKAEQEQELANQINHLSVKKLAKIASKQKAKLIHISTDYVFDGKSDKPYKETDMTNPINVYGKTKLKGEQAVQEVMPANAIIIRTSWLYSEFGNNFVDTMLRLGKERNELNVVSDQVGSPTYATDLANAILEIIQNKEFKEAIQVTQVYHYSNEGEISWYEFAKGIFELSNIKCEISPIKTNQYPAPAERPENTIMSKDKIVNTFDVNIPDWKTSLKACLMSNH
jgi:dTDP-4-dehydrorhamnose reductase